MQMAITCLIYENICMTFQIQSDWKDLEPMLLIRFGDFFMTVYSFGIGTLNLTKEA